MLYNYLKIALRNLKRKRAYTLINIVGLALGFACAILIFSFVKYHLSFDTFHSKKDRIYRIVTEDHMEKVFYYPGTPPPVGKAFRNDYTFSEKVSRVYIMQPRLISLPFSAENHKFLEDQGVAFAEPGFFDIMDFPLIKGDKKNLLTEPNTALVTERIAKKYFGDANPIGKIIRIENKQDFRITGILADLPQNTDRRQEIYVPFSNLKEYNSWAAGDDGWDGVSSNFQCFVLLKPGISPSLVNKVFPAFSRKYYDGDYELEWQYRLQPLSDIHFNPDFEGKMSRRNLWALSLIGIFLIITAAVNFINLATAQALNRAREVGIRKALGGQRGQLFWQFIIETTIINVIAMLLAFVLIRLTLPFLSVLLDIPVDNHFFRDSYLLLFLPLLLVLVIFLSGAYPGLVMAGFQPVRALKGQLSQKHVGGFSLRRGLVIIQFVISQLLIIGTLIIVYQMHYVNQINMGFQKDAIIMVRVPSNAKSKISTLRSELSRLPAVEKFSFCNQPPPGYGGGREMVYDTRRRRENYDVVLKWGDEQYLSTFGLQLLAGRNLYPSDTTREYLVNETLVKKLGVRNEDVIGKNAKLDDVNGTIVGLIKDFHNESLHNSIAPLAIASRTRSYEFCAVKINTVGLQATISALQKVWAQVYPDNVFQSEFLDERIAQFYKQDQRIQQIIQTFTAVAIFIACLGLYGLVSFMAARKTKEVGVRKVLGASIHSILWLFGKEFIRLLLIAFVIAAPLSWYIMNKWLESFAYRISPGIEIFILAIFITLSITGLTVGYTSVKAALMNPVKSLRSE
ncbi:FtsX-like permease family protein [Chitinophaga oryziterrae]|uniref:FtsX-like permease family protein n=1 Tax=Chitinophaga oryziterrae TaxID=1031224 RepID=A0A6N8JLT0_9BACT|nr:ABC transporter permease [Chitinophaga oryziterrae]MVT45208.1 FtsX-like permease family protein [Chitinophaga oryziterrae]